MSTRDTIRAFIADTFFVEGFADDASFLRNGIIDSTGMLELVQFVERSFSIAVADNELVPDNFDSLANLERYLERKSALAAAA
jgi:acyl carrier protein